MMAYDDHVEGVFQQQSVCAEERDKATEALKRLEVKITKSRSQTEVPLDLYEVEMTSTSGVWFETFGSKSDLDIFLSGFKAAAGMMHGGVTIIDPVSENLLV